MTALSILGRLILALLVVLWQPVCLCQEGGGQMHDAEASSAHEHHTRAEERSAAEENAHHDHHASHDESGSPGHDDGTPCDHGPSGCDCSKAFAAPLTSSTQLKGALGEFQVVPVFGPPAYIALPAYDVPFVYRNATRQGLSPPRLLALYCVLRI